MQRTKKIISALLAIVMLVSVFTTGASAATAVSGSYKTLAYYVVTDATGNEVTEVSAGQEVTVNVYLNAAAAKDDLSSAQLQIWYDDEVYSYVDDSLTWGTTIQGWYDESQSEIKPFDENNTNSLYNNSIKAATADGTLTAHPNWLSCLILYVVDAGSETYYIQENADEAIASFKLKVADDVTAGDDFAIGCPSSLVWTKAVSSRGAAYHYVKSAKTGTIGSGEVEPVPTVALSYKEAAEPSIVNPLRDGQIRFHKNGTAYAGSFDVRALAVISGDDFDATFTDIATAKTMISEIGFVFAQGANVTAPSMDAVKALVENGTATAGYAKKTVNYISTSVEPDSYVFSCIATDIPDAEKNNSLVAVGYIAYTVDGETVYAYYPAAQTISFAGLFNTHYADAFGA